MTGYTPTSFGTPTDWSSLSNWGLDPGQMGMPGNFELPGVTAAPGAQPSIIDSLGGWLNNSGFLGKKMSDGTQMQGWGAPAISAASGLLSGFMGMKQYQLAKDQLAQNKNEFQLNYDAQKKTTNSALSDRQAARVASNPGAYQSVGDYMKTYGI